MSPEKREPITVIVSKSEPSDACDRLAAFGINAVPGEAGSDYVWFPHRMKCAVERKTISNLLQSLSDRQLVEQTHRGVAQFDFYIILIEGEMHESPDGFFSYYSPRDPRADSMGVVKTKWRWEAVQGMLLDLQLLGAMVVQCKSFDYARKIAMLAATTTSEHHAFMSERQRPDLPAATALGGKLYSNAIWALCALDGCGPEIAMALLAHCGSLHAAVELIATDCSTVKVKGKSIGPKRAARLREAVLEKVS